MKIGELARKTSTQVETIRYYEREGLLNESGRTQGNYRVYDSSHAARLTFIRHCRALDMTLDEVRVLLRFRDAPEENCANVNLLIDEHIAHVAERVRELRLLKRQLQALRGLCDEAKETGCCAILDELGHGAHKGSGVGPLAHVAGVHGKAQSIKRSSS